MMAAPWVGKAVGERRPADEGEVRRALALLADPAAGVEVRGLPSGRSATRAGADPDGLWAVVRGLEGERGVYLGLNPVPPNLARPMTVGDVLRRRWLMVDCDPRRPKDTNATDAEHGAAREAAGRVEGHLTAAGWPEPVLIDSGNGYQLLYRVELPHDDAARVLLRRFLRALAGAFDSEAVEIDTKVHAANRHCKLPGTWVMKGPRTAERPFRLARLVRAPAEPGVVPRGQIAAQAGGEPQPSSHQTQRSPFRGRAPRTGRAAAYARAALQAEVARVAGAAPGSRNQALNDAAFALGQLVGAGLLTREEVERALSEAAERVGLEAAEVRATLKSGLDAGVKEPREVTPRPAPVAKAPSANGAGAAPPPGEAERLTVSALRVTPRQVEYLWPGRVPLRFLTVFAGRTGLGKSFVTCDFVARMTTGREVPEGGGERFPSGAALLISEDPHEYVLAPRLIELGADLSRVHFMKWKAMAQWKLTDTEMLNRACAEVPGIRLVVIDPPTNFLGEADEHRNAEVRQTLMELVAWIQERDMACVLILHVNKQTGKGIEALNRVMGSVAWVTTARVAHTFAPDPDDPERCLFVPMKSNVGKIPRGLAYRIEGTKTLARVEWLGEVDITADEAMAGSKSRPRAQVAAEWLAERFREKRVWPSDELFKRGRHDGIFRDAIFAAKRLLDIPRARKVVAPNGDVTWEWWVPDTWSQSVDVGPTIPPVPTVAIDGAESRENPVNPTVDAPTTVGGAPTVEADQEEF